MKNKKIKENHQRITEKLLNKETKSALDILREMIKSTQINEFILQHERHSETYRYILKYTIEGVEDPEREKIHQRLQKSILELADRVKQTILMNNSDIPVNHLKQKYNSAIQFTNKQLLDALTLPYDVIENNDDYLKAVNRRNEMLDHAFHRLWLTDKYQQNEIELVQKITHSKDIVWYEKAVMVSALTLSLCKFFDPIKINLLIEIFELSENQIWHRALVGLFISLFIYDKRLHLYPDIVEKLKHIYHDDRLKKNIENIIIQFIKSKETEKISKKIREEIIPEVAKITPKITQKLNDKLDFENIFQDDFSEDKNPEWEEFFEDTPDLFEKMGELSMMQLDGSDVFMSTFSMLKHFPFFQRLTNWFLPFYEENPLMVNEFASEEFDGEVLLHSLQETPFFCNSDKYSFCLNIKHIPPAQKPLLINLFSSDIEGMREIAGEDEVLDKSKKDKFIFTQYIQDLYRFYKLHTYKMLFTDIFESPMDVQNTNFFEILFKEDYSILRNVAEFAFSKNRYSEALDIYLKLHKNDETNFEIIQKSAYCYQKLKRYQKALDFYLKAELFDKNKVWNLKKIAFCYQRLSKPEEALDYYRQAEKMEPDNLQIQVNIGRCYLAMDNYEEALKFFFKVEYLAPSNIKVLRPIAWCSFLTGNFDNARKYFERVVEIEGNKHDYINLGHVEWCLNNRKKAVEYYIRSLKQEDRQYNDFVEEFNIDRSHLIENGIDENEIPLMLDFLNYEFENKK